MLITNIKYLISLHQRHIVRSVETGFLEATSTTYPGKWLLSIATLPRLRIGWPSIGVTSISDSRWLSYTLHLPHAKSHRYRLYAAHVFLIFHKSALPHHPMTSVPTPSLYPHSTSNMILGSSSFVCRLVKPAFEDIPSRGRMR